MLTVFILRRGRQWVSYMDECIWAQENYNGKGNIFRECEIEREMIGLFHDFKPFSMQIVLTRFNSIRHKFDLSHNITKYYLVSYFSGHFNSSLFTQSTNIMQMFLWHFSLLNPAFYYRQLMKSRPGLNLPGQEYSANINIME